MVLDDIEVDAAGKCCWGDVANAAYEIEREMKMLQAALQNMIDIYWADGDGHLPEPRCIIEARAALSISSGIRS